MPPKKTKSVSNKKANLKAKSEGNTDTNNDTAGTKTVSFVDTGSNVKVISTKGKKKSKKIIGGDNDTLDDIDNIEEIEDVEDAEDIDLISELNELDEIDDDIDNATDEEIENDFYSQSGDYDDDDCPYNAVSNRKKKHDVNFDNFDDDPDNDNPDNDLDDDVLDDFDNDLDNQINDSDEFENQTKKRIVDPAKRICNNMITKYERVRLLGERTTQLALGAKPMIKGIDGIKNTNPEEIIAQLEFEARMIPIIIERERPDGFFEEWKLSELKYKEDMIVYGEKAFEDPNTFTINPKNVNTRIKEIKSGGNINGFSKVKQSDKFAIRNS